MKAMLICFKLASRVMEAVGDQRVESRSPAVSCEEQIKRIHELGSRTLPASITELCSSDGDYQVCVEHGVMGRRNLHTNASSPFHP